MSEELLALLHPPQGNVLFYRRMPWPGEVRREERGTPFRVAGATLRRVVEYDRRGQATLHLLAEGENTALAESRDALAGMRAEQEHFTQTMKSFPVLLVMPLAVLEQQRFTLQDTGSSTGEEARATPATSVNVGSSCDDKGSLRAAVWGGCQPSCVRAAAWRLLQGIALPVLSRQQLELGRRRQAYVSYTEQYFTSAAETFYQARSTTGTGSSASSASRDAESVLLSSRNTLAPQERTVLQQITLDLPRHRTPAFHCPTTSASLARCLFLWALRHPSSGYVQGMDDIAGVCYLVFLSAAVQQALAERAGLGPLGGAELGVVLATVQELDSPPLPSVAECRSLEHILRYSPARLSALSHEAFEETVRAVPPAYLLQVEADTYWAFSSVLSSLQDSYIAGQPGIQQASALLGRVVALFAPHVAAHFEALGLRLVDGCFQWLHCLFVREFPLEALLALWDTYLCVSEMDARGVPEGGSGIQQLHIFTCAALLRALQPLLLDADMPTAIQILKKPYTALFPPAFNDPNSAAALCPVQRLKEKAWIETLIADAYCMWKNYSLRED